VLETASKPTIRLVAREAALTSQPERHTLSSFGCVKLCLAAVFEIGIASLCGVPPDTGGLPMGSVFEIGITSLCGVPPDTGGLPMGSVFEIGSAPLCGANQAMSDRAGPRGDARITQANCAGRAK